MNNVLGSVPDYLELCNFVTRITLLLDTGAEFANLSSSRGHRWPFRWLSLPIRMTLIASSAELVDCKVNSVRLFPYADALLKL